MCVVGFCVSPGLAIMAALGCQFVLAIKGSVFEMGLISCLPLSRCLLDFTGSP